MAFARLREAGIEPERLLAIHMAVGALIEDDNGSHRVDEFRLVQTAKAVHRLASGTHRQWDFPMRDGTTRPLHFHAYPRSSGIVLRVIGREIDEICGGVAEAAVQEVIAARLAKFGPHPSHLPGWKPPWMQQARSGDGGGSAQVTAGTIQEAGQEAAIASAHVETETRLRRALEGREEGRKLNPAREVTGLIGREKQVGGASSTGLEGRGGKRDFSSSPSP